MLAAACQMFMGKSEGEISHIALETLEGHQRAIIAHLTVEVNKLFVHTPEHVCHVFARMILGFSPAPNRPLFSPPYLSPGDLQRPQEVL